MPNGHMTSVRISVKLPNKEGFLVWLLLLFIVVVVTLGPSSAGKQDVCTYVLKYLVGKDVGYQVKNETNF